MPLKEVILLFLLVSFSCSNREDSNPDSLEELAHKIYNEQPLPTFTLIDH